MVAAENTDLIAQGGKDIGAEATHVPTLVVGPDHHNDRIHVVRHLTIGDDRLLLFC